MFLKKSVDLVGGGGGLYEIAAPEASATTKQKRKKKEEGVHDEAFRQRESDSVS